MDPLSLNQLAQMAGAVRENGHGEWLVTNVSTDSRTLRPGELFVALRGDNFDGHKFIGQAMQRGAAGAIVEKGWTGNRRPIFLSSGSPTPWSLIKESPPNIGVR